MKDSEKTDTISHLARHSIIYAIGDFAAKGIGFLLLPVYTRYLNPAQYGVLELLDLVSYIAGFIAAMGIAQAMSRFYQESQSDEERGEIVSAALTAVVTACLVFLAAASLFVPEISNLVFSSQEYARALQVVFLSLVFGLVTEVPLTLMRLEQRSILYVVLSLVRTLVTLSFSIYFVVVKGWGIYGVLYASNITASLFGIGLIVWLFRNIKFNFKWERLKPLLGYGLPLIGSWLGAFVLNFADRFFLQRLSSLDSVGIYAVAYKFGMLPNMLVLAPFLMVWSTRQFEIARREDSAEIFSRLFVYLIFAELYVLLLVSLPIREALSIVVSTDYDTAANYVPALLLAYLFYAIYAFNQFGLLQAKKTGVLSGIVLSCAVLNLALNYLLIPHGHVWGATLATLLSFGFLATAVGVVSQRAFAIAYDTPRLVRLVAVAAALIVVGWLLPIPHVVTALIVRFLLALSFPLWLALIGFFQPNELEFVRRIIPKRLLKSPAA